MSHSRRAALSPLIPHVVRAACWSLELLKYDVLIAVLRFLRDFIDNGGPDSPYSGFDQPAANSPEVQATVKQLLHEHGQEITERVLRGMMETFPEDCIPDASGVVLDLLNVLPQETTGWIATTLQNLPANSIRPQEREKLAASIQQWVHTPRQLLASTDTARKISGNDFRKIRVMLQDFTSSYRRRNVAPREGLGRPQSRHFQYSGP
jgi:transportin-3